jgi:alkylresorcinol/alkylpyrone synthase
MSFITKAVTSFPEQIVSQSELKNLLIKVLPEKKDYIEEVMNITAIKSRHFTLPLNYYRDLRDVGKRNIIWKAEALRLQKENIEKLLTKSKIDIADIGLIVSATSSGFTVPSLDALMMNQFNFSPFTKRLPLFGLGSLAGVAGVNRVNDYLISHPASAAILMVTELCSLNFQLEDESNSNIMNTSLFGDGAAALLMVGKNHPMAGVSHYEIIANESIFYPNTERMMECSMNEQGLQIAESLEVPKMIKELVGLKIDNFLNKNFLSKSDINYFIAHPGSPNILEALGETLGHEKDKFFMSWESLKNKGNMSAVSVLHALELTIDSADIAPNSLGLMIAMGPGFCLELTLVKKT